MKVKKGYTFDDVLLVPSYSEVKSRSNVDLSVDLGKGIKLKGPYISANMRSITGPVLASKMHNWGMGLLHRFDTIDNQIKNYQEACTVDGNFSEEIANTVGVSVGVNSFDDIDKLLEGTNSKIVCVDVAHGDHKNCLDVVTYIAKKYPGVLLIAGNIATGQAALRLENAGADVVKCGIGGGSNCSTRIETGNGVPQLSALEDVYNTLNYKYEMGQLEPRHSGYRTKIIADGGIKKSGDVVKSLCFSDAVMIGSLLSGTEEAAEEIVFVDGERYKMYSGSSTHKKSRIEGVSGLVPYKGPMANVMTKLVEGLQSGCSYQGCDNLIDLKESPQFIEISNAGLIESRPTSNLKNQDK
jgi:IMP dehydrogenase